MKTQNKKLSFNKKDIAELNKEALNSINGGTIGTTPLTSNITIITKITKMSNNTLCTSDA